MALEPSPIVPVYCRYVHTDRWLFTHLDSSWTISQVKQHLLTKFLPTLSPPLPRSTRVKRERPLSPITFSSHGHTGSDTDGDSDYHSAEESMSAAESIDVEDDGEFYRYKYAPTSRTPGHSSTTLVPAIEASLPSPANYVLLAFSTGQLMEDPFHLSWYSPNPYELFEFYPRGDAFIPLPRYNVEAYVRPYFEARVWALRFVGDDLSADRSADLERPKARGKTKGKERERRAGNGGGSAAGDVGEDAWGGEGEEMKRRLERKHKKKMEWRERWVVVHQGILKLCRSRSDTRPAYTAPLTALLALRGGEYLHPRTTSVLSKVQDPSTATSTPLSSPSPAQPHLQPLSDPMKHPNTAPKYASACDARRRVVCARFRAGPHPPPHSPAHTHAVAAGSGGGDLSGWWRRGSRDATVVETFGRRDGHAFADAASQDRLGAGDEDENSVWIIMDLLNDSTFNDFLRVLHRHAPVACSSSFTSRLSAEGTTSDAGYVFAPSGGPPYRASPGPSSSSPPTSAGSPTLTGSPGVKNTAPFARSASATALPYPEWRQCLVHRARRAGVGSVGRAMEFVMFGGDTIEDTADASDDDLFTHFDTPGNQEPIHASPARTPLAKQPSIHSQINLSPTLWRNYLNDDSDSESDAESELSEQEWENWMGDLPRQRRILTHTAEQHLRHLSADIEEDEDDEDDIAWARDEPPSDDGTGLPTSDDSEHVTSITLDSPPGGAGEPFPPSRTITTYSSVDSFIRKSVRPSRSRPRILGGVDIPNARPRSPLSRVRASEESVITPRQEFGSSPPGRTQLPVRLPIPMRMRMMSLRSTPPEGGTSPPEAAASTSPRLPAFLRKGPSTGASGSGKQTLQDPFQKIATAAATPPSLVLTIPEPASSGSSPSSMESIKFATPDSE